MKCEIEEFIAYLHNTKGTSQNTEVSYERDLRKMDQFLRNEGVDRVQDVTATNLNSYEMYLEREKFAASTISRSIASMRAFFQYCCQQGMLSENPADILKAPKIEKKMPGILTVEEVDLLLNQPKENTAKGVRDKAMLELLYATGIRVSELSFLTVEALHKGKAEIRMKGKIRTILLTKELCRKLNAYAKEKGIRTGYLFCTRTGKPLDRSNICHDMKKLCRAARVNPEKVFPHNLRHLFAKCYYAIKKNLAYLADILGHASVDTTRIYVAMGTREHERTLQRMHLIS